MDALKRIIACTIAQGIEMKFGVEEEFFLLSHGMPYEPTEDLFKASESMPFSLGREPHAASLEVISPILDSPPALASHIISSREWLFEQGEKHGFNVYAGGTHPTIHYKDVKFRDNFCDTLFLQEYGSLYQSCLTFGQHVHIGNIPRDKMARVFNKLRPWQPFLMALAANSQYFSGEDTGIACYRQMLYSRMPRTGTPPRMISPEHSKRMNQTLLEKGCIYRPTLTWHDLRHHPIHNTFESRVMDMNPDASGGAFNALIVALLGHLSLTLPTKDSISPLPSSMPDWMIEENRWRAIRYGRDASFITPNGNMSITCILKTLCEKLPPQWHSHHAEIEHYILRELTDHKNNNTNFFYIEEKERA